MNITYPIRGAQVVPPVQNNVQPECITTCKVYDWVVVPTEEQFVSEIPSACLPQVANVTNLGVFCCPLPIEGQDEMKVASIRRGLPGLPESAAIVSICCTKLVRLSLVDLDNPKCPLCCIEAPITFFFNRVVLCLPEPFGAENISCEVLCCEAVGSIVCNELLVDLVLSIGIRVEAEVTLELAAKFCQPRLPIAPPTLLCPTAVAFPAQCNNFFPSDCCTTLDITITSDTTLGCGVDSFTGIVTCDGAPAAGIVVTLISSNPVVSFDPNPVITNEFGVFGAIANATNPGANFSDVTATATSCGVIGTATQTVNVVCPQ